VWGGNSKGEFMLNSTSIGGKYNDMQGLIKEKAETVYLQLSFLVGNFYYNSIIKTTYY